MPAQGAASATRPQRNRRPLKLAAHTSRAHACFCGFARARGQPGHGQPPGSGACSVGFSRQGQATGQSGPSAGKRTSPCGPLKQAAEASRYGGPPWPGSQGARARCCAGLLRRSIPPRMCRRSALQIAICLFSSLHRIGPQPLQPPPRPTAQQDFFRLGRAPQASQPARKQAPAVA